MSQCKFSNVICLAIRLLSFKGAESTLIMTTNTFTSLTFTVAELLWMELLDAILLDLDFIGLETDSNLIWP